MPFSFSSLSQVLAIVTVIDIGIGVPFTNAWAGRAMRHLRMTLIGIGIGIDIGIGIRNVLSVLVCLLFVLFYAVPSWCGVV